MSQAYRRDARRFALPTYASLHYTQSLLNARPWWLRCNAAYKCPTNGGSGPVATGSRPSTASRLPRRRRSAPNHSIVCRIVREQRFQRIALQRQHDVSLNSRPAPADVSKAKIHPSETRKPFHPHVSCGCTKSEQPRVRFCRQNKLLNSAKQRLLTINWKKRRKSRLCFVQQHEHTKVRLTSTDR